MKNKTQSQMRKKSWRGWKKRSIGSRSRTSLGNCQWNIPYRSWSRTSHNSILSRARKMQVQRFRNLVSTARKLRVRRAGIRDRMCCRIIRWAARLAVIIQFRWIKSRKIYPILSQILIHSSRQIRMLILVVTITIAIKLMIDQQRLQPQLFKMVNKYLKGMSSSKQRANPKEPRKRGRPWKRTSKAA